MKRAFSALIPLRCILSALLTALSLSGSAQGKDHLPQTDPLPPSADRSLDLIRGAHRFTDRLEQENVEFRSREWQSNFSAPGDYPRSIESKRSHLREMLGIVDARVPAELTQVGPLLGEERLFSRIHWNTLDGLHGDGWRIAPHGESKATLIFIPDADEAPEQILSAKGNLFREKLLQSPFKILIPRLVNRETSFSGNEILGIHTNCSHREWIYRHSFILGRTPAGLEVQKVLALVDSLCGARIDTPIFVAGEGEGGRLAFLAAALDERIRGAIVSGYFGPREKLSEEPLEHNVFGLIKTFGDAEIAALIAPRPLLVRHASFPVERTHPAPRNARHVAAPGKFMVHQAEAARGECHRASQLVREHLPQWSPIFLEESSTDYCLQKIHPELASSSAPRVRSPEAPEQILLQRQREAVSEMSAYCQGLIPILEKRRTEAMRALLSDGSGKGFYKGLEARRDAFWDQIIGRIQTPFLPIQSRSRLVRETDSVSIYEVEITVWQDVPAWGWLCIPKALDPGIRHPVVVCQHGLEGLPENLFETDETTAAWRAYKAFALRLSEQGFITFSPHNLYRGKDRFRSLQRRLNPLGLSIFSIINGQHQRILEWLGGLPWVDARRIAFYGLSYGGKTAMRTPAVLPGYCLSICSGDFNEWIRKCASPLLPMSYLFVGEHEIWEWNLAAHANYAEMAALIAPRPFMVERGHRDGVGSDEWVNYEFAKVRRTYSQLGIGERTEIEHFDGPHTIHGVGTFDFLKRYLQHFSF